MNYIEIILKNVSIRYLDKLIEYLIYDSNNIISSHFFDNESSEDLEYHNIDNLQEFFCKSGTCHIVIKELDIGIKIENALILVAFDGISGDITINFSEGQFETQDVIKMSYGVQRFVRMLLDIANKYDINQIVIGYEPADDLDMKILEIINGNIKTYNKRNSKRGLAEKELN